ncbi:SCAN domain-containing protein 3 [Trichonephila clavipes]|nr:SCAN domain-containing protein 3 [Trichonephila clavipes]
MEKNHTIGEYLIKPSISAFLKTVLEKEDKDVKAMPLSKNTVSRRTDEMGEDIEKQFVEKMKTRKLSVQVEESTLRDSEAVLITYFLFKNQRIKQAFCETSLKRNTNDVQMNNEGRGRWSIPAATHVQYFVRVLIDPSDFIHRTLLSRVVVYARFPPSSVVVCKCGELASNSTVVLTI